MSHFLRKYSDKIELKLFDSDLCGFGYLDLLERCYEMGLCADRHDLGIALRYGRSEIVKFILANRK